MEPDKLIRMANHIAEFFAAAPTAEDGVDGVATHLRKFWAPAMRAQLQQHAAAGAEGMHPLVREALKRLAAAPAANPPAAGR